jgi:hypothetical protein
MALTAPALTATANIALGGAAVAAWWELVARAGAGGEGTGGAYR